MIFQKKMFSIRAIAFLKLWTQLGVLSFIEGACNYRTQKILFPSLLWYRWLTLIKDKEKKTINWRNETILAVIFLHENTVCLKYFFFILVV